MVEMVMISSDFLSQVDNFLVDRVSIEQALGDQQLFAGLQPAFIVGARVGGARFRRGDFLNELIVPFCPAVLAIGGQLIDDRKCLGFPRCLKNGFIFRCMAVRVQGGLG